MANDRRRNYHDANGVTQQGSYRSSKGSPDLGMSFSIRMKNNELLDDEFSDIEEEETGSSKGFSRDRSSSNRKESPRSRSSRDYHDSENKSYVPSKAMRRNSCGSNLYGSTTKAKRRNSWHDSFVEEYPISFRSTDHTTPLSYSVRDSERSDPRSYMTTEDKESINYIHSEHSRARSSSRDHSSKRKSLQHSQHSRRKSLQNSQHSKPRSLSRDRSGTKETYGNERRRKAKRRNSCEYEVVNLRHSTVSDVKTNDAKAKRRNSYSESFSEEFSISYMGSERSMSHNENNDVEYTSAKEYRSPRSAKSRSNSSENEPNSVKPSTAKARRRNSCNYDPESHNTAFVDKMNRRNSWNDSYAEEYHRQSKGAEQRPPRRLKSNPNPGKNTKRSKKKKSSSSNKKSSKSTKKEKQKETQKETQNNPPRSLRLNSQFMRKIGDFRPYFVPLRKKQEVLNTSDHQDITQTFNLSQEIVCHTTHDGPAQLLHEAMKNISVASFLHEGVPVVKISHNNGKLRRRVLTLSEDQTTLFLTHSKLAKGTRNVIPKQPTWTPSKGWNGTYIRSIDVSNIYDFQVGVISSRWLELALSPQMKKAKKKDGENQPSEESRGKNYLPYMPDPARVASAVTIFHIDARTGRMDSLDFFIENKDHRRAVVATLALMKYSYDEVSQLVGNEILLYRYIIKDMNLGTSVNDMTEMNETEFLSLCRRLNFSAPNVAKEFREFNKQHTEKYIYEGTGKTKHKLPIHECLQLIQLLKGKENPSVAAWRACFGTATCVNALTVLTKFLHGPQQEEKISDIQDARDLVNVMNATELGEVLSNRKGSLLTQWQFQEFLRSEWNDIYNPEKRVIDKQRPLDKPLSHYWINASFRTSSMSDGVPSVQSYARALARGCKSIDLNCWDGIILPNGENVPTVSPSNENPGTSFTVKNKLTFRSVVLVVRKYLLENSETYPIIFNVENNCSQPFQRSIVKTTNELFGKLLFDPASSSDKKELPSPEELRGRVVLNVRKPTMRGGADTYRSKSFCGDVDAYSTMFNKFNAVSPNSFRGPSSFRSQHPESSASRSFTSRSRGNKQLGQELISLSLLQDIKFSGYFLESMDLPYSQMHGIKDVLVPKIVKEYSDNPDLWRKFNGSHLTRVYPTGGGKKSTSASVSHSNYNPVLAWGMGCQMATLNFHNDDTALAVNDGFFRQTGQIGYLEKPQWLLGIGERPKSTSIKIRVLSGSCLPKAFVSDKDAPTEATGIDSPRVVLELHDVIVRSGQGERFKISKHKVECGNNNGFFPIFEDKGKKFTVETPDVAMLVFRIEQDTEKGKILSTTAIPVNCLRKGYRSVQLHDTNNTKLGRFASASLLVFLM